MLPEIIIVALALPLAIITTLICVFLQRRGTKKVIEQTDETVAGPASKIDVYNLQLALEEQKLAVAKLALETTNVKNRACGCEINVSELANYLNKQLTVHIDDLFQRHAERIEKLSAAVSKTSANKTEAPVSLPTTGGFRVGDVVECIEPNRNSYISKGQKYTVISVDESFVHIVDNNGSIGGYLPYRFKLCNPSRVS